MTTRASEISAVTVAVVLLFAAACTREDPVPAGLLTPAPRECPMSIVRADSMEPAKIRDQLRGHLPPTLPIGFGLVGVWGEGDGVLGSALWADGTCRLFGITIWPEEQLPAGPELGDWVVEESGIHDCGNAVLGDGRCLRYRTVTEGVSVEVFMMGIERNEGDGIVLSVRS